MSQNDIKSYLQSQFQNAQGNDGALAKEALSYIERLEKENAKLHTMLRMVKPTVTPTILIDASYSMAKSGELAEALEAATKAAQKIPGLAVGLCSGNLFQWLDIYDQQQISAVKNGIGPDAAEPGFALQNMTGDNHVIFISNDIFPDSTSIKNIILDYTDVHTQSSVGFIHLGHGPHSIFVLDDIQFKHLPDVANWPRFAQNVNTIESILATAHYFFLWLDVKQELSDRERIEVTCRAISNKPDEPIVISEETRKLFLERREKTKKQLFPDAQNKP